MRQLYYLAFLLVSFLMSGGLRANEPVPWQRGFQPSATPIMDKIVALHDHLLFIILIVGLLVCSLMLYVLWRFRASRNPEPSTTTHHTLLEVVWTAVPALVVLVLAFPSLKLIYFADKTRETDLTLKIVGRQWYWHYDYPDHKIEFDSTMVQTKDLKDPRRRLLEVDHEVVLPVDTNIRLLLTASDVIHSWAIPAFGIKQDTVPGRLKEIWVRIKREGTFYGQCSEICGVGHAFMPIAVKVVSKEKFKEWIEEAKQKFAANDAFSLPITLVSQ